MAVRWHGDAISREIRSELNRRLRTCADLVRNRARELLSVPGTAKRGKKTRTKRKGSRIFGFEQSKPGEPPRKQHGALRRSVNREVKGLIARIGTNSRVGRWLEKGTRRYAPRPWLGRALMESRDEIRRILMRQMR